MILKTFCYSLILVSATLIKWPQAKSYGQKDVSLNSELKSSHLNIPQNLCNITSTEAKYSADCLMVDTFYVGNAEMIRLIFPTKKGKALSVILDSGSSGPWWEEDSVRAEWFVQRNKLPLLGIIHSHDDLDHIANQERFRMHFKSRLLSPADEGPLWQYLLQIGTQNLSIENINPDSLVSEHREENKNSSVLWINFDQYQLVFTGDINTVQEKKIMSAFQKKRNNTFPLFLKAAHHASKTSNSVEMLQTLAPQTVWASLEFNDRKRKNKIDTRITELQKKFQLLSKAPCLIRSAPKKVQRFFFCPQKRKITWAEYDWWQVL